MDGDGGDDDMRAHMLRYALYSQLCISVLTTLLLFIFVATIARTYVPPVSRTLLASTPLQRTIRCVATPSINSVHCCAGNMSDSLCAI